MIYVKRVYEPADEHDGARFLVDRLWPRGLTKEALRADTWIKAVSPSDALRHWFGHETTPPTATRNARKAKANRKYSPGLRSVELELLFITPRERPARKSDATAAGFSNLRSG
jgi:hypothetical protein